jgi:hypothetical protein
MKHSFEPVGQALLHHRLERMLHGPSSREIAWVGRAAIAAVVAIAAGNASARLERDGGPARHARSLR